MVSSSDEEEKEEEEEEEEEQQLQEKKKGRQQQKREQQAEPAPKASSRRGGALNLQASLPDRTQPDSQQQQQQLAPSQSGRDAFAVLLGARHAVAAGVSGATNGKPRAAGGAGLGSSDRPAADDVPAREPAPAGLASQLWVDKHAPQGEGGQVVHKRKVQEVRQWLENQLATLGRPGVPRVLVVSGVEGCCPAMVVVSAATTCCRAGS